MAARVLFSFVFIPLLFSYFPSPCSCLKYADSMVVAGTKQVEKVNLALYYEALCPGSREFILKYLVDVFDLGLIDIVNLKLVPWGNAKLTQPNDTIVCQHGEDECYFNTIQACAIEALPDPTKHFKFIHCVIKKTSNGPIHGKEEIWRSCCQGQKEVEQHIQNCYECGHGKELELKYHDETPDHDYVPWVIINDKHIEAEDLQNLVVYICKAYKGSQVPEVCKTLPPAVAKATEKAISSTPVCYAY